MNMSASLLPIVQPVTLGLRRMFIRDLMVEAEIGIYAFEHGQRQRVRVNIDLAVEDTPVTDDRIAEVVSYEPLVLAVRRIVAQGGHVQLVETLAERIASHCFDDRRVRQARVRVEKLDIFADAEAVGVEIERPNPAP
jgi:7,8-dihydroneopterin aldolase/epimerase/oxygenase